MLPSAVNRYLMELVDKATLCLGEELVAAYAAGSIALDAYQPGRSDIDVALVTARGLSRSQKSELVSRLRHQVLPCPARGLELVVYSRAAAASGTAEPGFEVELNTGGGMAFRATWSGDERAEADGRFWYAIDRSILREHGRPLIGPPAYVVFGEVSRSDLRALLIASLTWYLALPQPTGNEPAEGASEAVLGACRAMVRVAMGEWLGKVAAGRRLMEAGHDRELISRAIAARLGEGPEPGAADARAYQQSVLNTIIDSLS